MDWTTRDVTHLSLVPVREAAEALCGALVVSYDDPDLEGRVLQRCARCARTARALVGASHVH
jgi:hypothetical protein